MTYCQKCGNKLDEDSKFCFKCGTVVSSKLNKPQIRERKRKPRKTMNILSLSLIVIIIVVVLAMVSLITLGFWRPFGGIVGSGNLTTEEMNLDSFNVLDIGSGFKVEITQSTSYGVSITADDNIFEYIQASTIDDKLLIELNTLRNYHNITLKAEVLLPELYGVEFSGGIIGNCETFSSSNNLVLDLSGGSFLEIDELSMNDIEIDLSGGSRIELSGTANDLLIDGSSGSHFDLPDFSVRDVNIELSGGSSANINLNGELDADLSGGSSLQYAGNPTVENIQKSGGSTADKIE